MLVFLFTDIEGSTQLWDEHTEEMGDCITRHDAILREQIEACGGTDICAVSMDASKAVTGTFSLEDTGYKVYLHFLDAGLDLAVGPGIGLGPDDYGERSGQRGTQRGGGGSRDDGGGQLRKRPRGAEPRSRYAALPVCRSVHRERFGEYSLKKEVIGSIV